MCTTFQEKKKKKLAVHNPSNLKLTQFFSKVEIYLTSSIFQDVENIKCGNCRFILYLLKVICIQSLLIIINITDIKLKYRQSFLICHHLTKKEQNKTKQKDPTYKKLWRCVFLEDLFFSIVPVSSVLRIFMELNLYKVSWILKVITDEVVFYVI